MLADRGHGNDLRTCVLDAQQGYQWPDIGSRRYSVESEFNFPVSEDIFLMNDEKGT